jgi:hypothetical protein
MSETMETADVQSTGELSLAEAAAMLSQSEPDEREAEQDQAQEADAPVVEGDEADQAEPDAEEKTEEAAAAPQMFKVKVNGEEREVPLQELLNGYSGTQAVSQRFEEAAAARREAEALQQRYASGISQMVEVLQSSAPKAPTLDLLNSDPVEYMRQKALFDEGQSQLAAYQAEQYRLSEEAKNRQAEQYAAFFQSQQRALHAKLPEWQDQAKASAEQTKLREHLAKLEFTDQEMNSAVDHRVIIMARESMLYRQIIAQQKSTAAVVQRAPPKVERPGVASNGVDRRTAISQAFDRNPTMDNGARLVASLLS